MWSQPENEKAIMPIIARYREFSERYPYVQPTKIAPDIVKLIWENRQPETLTLDKLRRGIPESREEQRKLFLS